MSTQKTATLCYASPAIALHWFMALILLAGLALGLYMVGLPLSPNKLKFYSWHKWIGITAFILLAIRIIYRSIQRPPELPKQMSTLQQWVAHAGHFALYFLMFAIPITGWLMSSASGFQTIYFGIMPIPDLIGKNSGLAQLLKQTHAILNYALIAAVVGHILAVIKHQLIDKDNLLARMLPYKSK